MKSQGSGAAAMRWLREISGLTQRELAAASTLSERTVRGLERGEIHRPHRASLLALAEAARLDHAQRAAFLRAWESARSRSLTVLNPQRPDLALAEATVRSEIEECLLATWNRFHVDADRRRSASRSRCIIEARRDGIDTVCVPLMSDRPGITPAVVVSETTGCSLRDQREFPDSGLTLLELALDRPLHLGEVAAFAYTLTPPAPGLDLFGSVEAWPRETSVRRLLNRVVDVTVVEVTFDVPPRAVVEIESPADGSERVVRQVDVDGDHRVQLVRRNARPGSYGFRWSWDG